MNNLKFTLAGSVCLILAFNVSVAGAVKREPVSHFIAVDVSQSSPVMRQSNFLKRLLPKLEEKLGQAFKHGDTVELTTVGIDDHDEIFSQSLRVPRRTSRAYKMIANYVMALHTKKKAQSETQLRSYFADTSFNCQPGSLVLLITDGIDSGGEFFNMGSVLDKKAKIPPLPDQLTNCNVLFMGIGVSVEGHKLSSIHKQTIRDAWRDFVIASGGRYSQAVTR